MLPHIVPQQSNNIQSKYSDCPTTVKIKKYDYMAKKQIEYSNIQF